MPERYWYLVTFKDGKRTERRVPRTPGNTRILIAHVKKLQESGGKAHLVGRTDSSMYPKGNVDEHRATGEMWCPYCRAWRFFAVPKFRPRAEIGTEPWYDNSHFRQGIKRCNWCHVSELDWWVCNANGTHAESRASKRRRRKGKARARR